MERELISVACVSWVYIADQGGFAVEMEGHVCQQGCKSSVLHKWCHLLASLLCGHIDMLPDPEFVFGL